MMSFQSSIWTHYLSVNPFHRGLMRVVSSSGLHLFEYVVLARVFIEDQLGFSHLRFSLSVSCSVHRFSYMVSLNTLAGKVRLLRGVAVFEELYSACRLLELLHFMADLTVNINLFLLNIYFMGFRV